MNEPTYQMPLLIDDCQRVTDWMLWVSFASAVDRMLNQRLVTVCAERSGLRERVALPQSLPLHTLLTELDLPLRARSVLARANITTVGELLRLTETDLLGLRNFGKYSLVSVKFELARHGLQLGMLRNLPVVQLSPDECRAVLTWFRQVSPHYRTAEDRRIAQALADFLQISLTDALADDRPPSASAHDADTNDDRDDDYDDEIPPPRPQLRLIHFDTTDNGDGGNDDDDDAHDDDDGDFDGAFDRYEGADGELGPDVLDMMADVFGVDDDEPLDMPGETWRHEEGWTPIDPEGWKEQPDADFWKGETAEDDFGDNGWQSDGE